MASAQEHHHQNVHLEDIPVERLAFCPVSGDPVDKQEATQRDHVREYGGKSYYFCCTACRDQFEENPEHYAHPSEHTGETGNLLHLFEKEHLVDTVWAFRFKPSQPLKWTAGQYLRVELPHENPDEEGTKRWFTISSAPYQGFVQITTRITNSTFKQALAHLKIGDTISMIERSEGQFTWQETDKPRIFVAGGIGITPYHSILRQRVHDRQPLDVTLIYGNRTKGIVFKELLDGYATENPEFRIDYVVGEPLTTEALAKLQPNLNASVVYVSGPEIMVDTLGEELIAAGLPKDQLKKDGFPNYTKTNY